MKKLAFLILALLLVGCSESPSDAERALAAENTRLRGELTATKRDLTAEIKAKQSHAVREEQAKQWLKQAERDLRAALDKLKHADRKQ